MFLLEPFLSDFITDCPVGPQILGSRAIFILSPMSSTTLNAKQLQAFFGLTERFENPLFIIGFFYLPKIFMIF